MARETDSSPIAPYVHLRELLDERDRRYEQRFDGQERAVAAALAAAEKAVTAALVAADRAVAKAELAADKRFDAVNEFRSTLSDQATQFMTRAEGGVLIDRNTKDIQEIKDRVNMMQGRGAGGNAVWVYLLGAISAITSVLAIYLAVAR